MVAHEQGKESTSAVHRSMENGTHFTSKARPERLHWTNARPKPPFPYPCEPFVRVSGSSEDTKPNVCDP